MNDAQDNLVVDTRVAHAGFDEHRFQGHGVFGELAGGTSTAGMFALALTGRVLSSEDCAMIDDFVACATMADPRIWPLKVTRTLAAYGKSMPAFAAGNLATDEAAVGPASVEVAMHQLRELVRLTDGAVQDPAAVRRAFAELRQMTPQLAGFGVPFRARDERVEAVCARVRARGRDQRTHWALLETLRACLREGEKKLELNMASAIAAIALDLGFEPEIGALFGSVLVAPCFLAHAREGALQSSSALRILPIDRVEYVGRSRRSSRERIETR